MLPTPILKKEKCVQITTTSTWTPVPAEVRVISGLGSNCFLQKRLCETSLNARAIVIVAAQDNHDIAGSETGKLSFLGDLP